MSAAAKLLSQHGFNVPIIHLPPRFPFGLGYAFHFDVWMSAAAKLRSQNGFNVPIVHLPPRFPFGLGHAFHFDTSYMFLYWYDCIVLFCCREATVLETGLMYMVHLPPRFQFGLGHALYAIWLNSVHIFYTSTHITPKGVGEPSLPASLLHNAPTQGKPLAETNRGRAVPFIPITMEFAKHA